MKIAEFLASAEHLPLIEAAAFLHGRGVVVVAPHPDDESLGCGGLLAAAKAFGLAVHVVVVSDGTGSHRGSKRFPSEALRALREAETLAAVQHLGLSSGDVTFLRLPDQHVPPSSGDAQECILATVARCGAGTVCVSWKHDPHCDHEASAKLVLGLRGRLGQTRIYFYPIWGWARPPDDEVDGQPSGWRVSITAYQQSKADAIAEHRSQTTDLIDDDPDGFRLTRDMLARFDRPYELYLEPRPSDYEPFQ